MKIKSSHEMFEAGRLARSQTAVTEADLRLDPLQALKLRIATGRAEESTGNRCRLGPDSVSRALSQIEGGGEAPLTAVYDGQLSPGVLARLIEAAKTPSPIPETA